MNANEMKESKHITHGQMIAALGITTDQFSAWAKKRHDALVDCGFLIEEKGKRRMYSAVIVPAFNDIRDNEGSVSLRLDMALMKITIDSTQNNGAERLTIREWYDRIEKYIEEKNIIPSIYDETIARVMTLLSDSARDEAENNYAAWEMMEDCLRSVFSHYFKMKIITEIDKFTSNQK